MSEDILQPSPTPVQEPTAARYVQNISTGIVMLDYKLTNGITDGIEVKSGGFIDLNDYPEEVLNSLRACIRGLTQRGYLKLWPDSPEARQAFNEWTAELMELSNPQFVESLVNKIRESTDTDWLHTVIKKYRQGDFKGIYQTAEKRLYDLRKEQSPEIWDASGLSV